MNRKFRSVLAATGALACLPAAAADGDLKALREEIAQMKHAYERRIEALEKRLAQAESAAHAGHADHGDHPADAGNPEIGLVLQGRAKKMKEVPERAISGYWSAGHAHGAEKRGLSLEHTELSFAANIDPNFRGVARLAVTGDGKVEVEEAAFSTRGLRGGLTVRGGRFRSDIGYQNARHPHEWDFADASLMQQVLFGAEGYRHDGVQLKWAAPTAFPLQFGAEIGRGATFPGNDRNQNGAGATAFFAKTGGEIGAAHAWQAGVSWFGTRAARRGGQHFEDSGGAEAEGFFTGRSRAVIADFAWKWAPNGNVLERNFKFQTEVFRRNESGSFRCDDAAATTPTTCTGGIALGDLATRQAGGYAQAVYQFLPQWRAGYRHDWLGRGSKSFDAATVFGALDAGNAYFGDYRPRRASVMLDWSNTEFSRLRLQYARDRSMQGLADNQWTLQYVMSLGAHGAHGF